jgi:hypothetical protein
MYSYKRTSHITKLATWNEFHAFIGSIGKKEQFVAIEVGCQEPMTR